MMRRSGVRSLVNLSNPAREILRLAESGNIPSTQVSNLAAAARIALACMSGWPDEPDLPVHSFGGVGAGGGGAGRALRTFGLAGLATGIGCARLGASANNSSAPPNINRK